LHLLDLLFGMAARGPRFFADGWGDRLLCEGMSLGQLFEKPIPRIRMKLGETRRTLGGLLLEGSFDSPEDRLPDCARIARVRVLLPEGEPRGAAVHLAASGDQGFAVRLRFAAPLLERGIAAVVLENAYYGARRPSKQIGPAVRSVSDLHLMGSATVQEGRALLRWLREGLRLPLVGVTGYSMGGQMAAMVGASVPFPCAVVPIAPTCSPDSVLHANGFIRHVAHWAALAGEGEDAEAARRGLCALLARFTVTALPPPRCPAAAIVVGTAQDGFVPPSDMRRIAEHWGSELRWLDAGHVSAVIRHQGNMRRAVLDAFDRLEASLRRVPPSGPSRPRRQPRGSAPRAPGAQPSAGARARWRGPAAARRT
jgi:dienelactone hydrolase